MNVAKAVGERAGALLEHPETEIFQDRNRLGESDQAAATISPEVELALGVARHARNAHASIGIAGEAAQAQDVGRALVRIGARAIAVGERVEIGERKPGRERRTGRFAGSSVVTRHCSAEP